jgi:hypothetical protein
VPVAARAENLDFTALCAFVYGHAIIAGSAVNDCVDDIEMGRWNFGSETIDVFRRELAENVTYGRHFFSPS